MAPNPHIKKACNAMKPLGFQEVKVKSVLKKLLKTYDNNWGFIEAEGYKVLLEAIFNQEDEQVTEKNNKEEETKESQDVTMNSGKKKAPLEQVQVEDDIDEDETPLKKRLRRKRDLSLSSSTSKKPKEEDQKLEDEDEMTELPPLKRYLRRKGERSVLNNTTPSINTSLMSMEPEDCVVAENESLAIVNNEPCSDHKPRIQEKCSSPVVEMEKSTDIIDVPLETMSKAEDEAGSSMALVVASRDITNGKENIEIPWINEINNEVPLPFHYITQSYVFQKALVKFSISSFSDDQSCFTCIGDCLNSPLCKCSIPYTLNGNLKEDFLEARISEARDQRKQVIQFCSKCPFKEQCKGHIKRKGIKECWINCGCSKRCVNRMVQRGIHSKLEVFFTSNGKGWGLRTVEKLSQGSFVCEYIGEILTIQELLDQRRLEDDEVASPVILDTYWGCEESCLEDNKALCLVGNRYGNISRFLNHRCLDANLIEIPVHVETPDQHYYHLAFFTTRDIEAMEELTWDYGIDFNDDDSLIKPFDCLCGSRFCRNLKRSKKTKKVMNRE